VQLKITDFGGSPGVILPREVLEKLGANPGDWLNLLETPMGYEITLGETKIERQMRVAERVMTENHETLRNLADHDSHPHPDLPQA
jgi:putative addiction module antidote